jgi:mRNA interferase RelE/StbE
MPTPYRIALTPTASSTLSAIKDRRIQEQLRDRIDGLAHDPHLQGKPLLGELTGYRSVRAASQRYRIIYRVQQNRLEVLVVAIGLRREGDREDVYRLAKRLLRLRLLG